VSRQIEEPPWAIGAVTGLGVVTPAATEKKFKLIIKFDTIFVILC